MTKSEFDRSFPAVEYDGKRQRLAEWRHAVVRREGSGDVMVSEHEFVSPDGLLKIRHRREEFRDFPALRCRNELIGCGATESRLITGFDALELAAALPDAGRMKVNALRGSKNTSEDFAAVSFAPADAEKFDFVCDEGRSSANWMPYFDFEFDDSSGCAVAVGWSGAWRLSCDIAENSFRCRFGMRDLATVVRSGETLLQPSALVFFRNGIGRREFQSVIHDFMVRHNAPHDRYGQLRLPLLPVTTSGGNHTPSAMKKVIAYAQQNLPCDTVWVDAGWNGPEHYPNTRTNCGDCWGKYVGDWRVNTGLHPSGSLRPVSDAAHAAGMKFLLWCEPERLRGEAPILRDHPEYARIDPGRRQPGEPPRWLLDLGNDAAWRWIFATLCRLIRDNGVDVYRQDFNLDPQAVWAAADDPDRRGVTEIRHIAGLYRLWDALRAEFPDLLIDNCASGGRRLDFELTARSHVYCRSDYFVPRADNLAAADGTPEKHRAQIVMGQNANVNTLAWVPFQASEMNCCSFFDDAELFSALGAGIVFSAPDWNHGSCECDFTEEETAWFRKALTVADRVRRILVGKFLPLTDPLRTDEETWAAFEGFLPEKNTGFAAFFRRRRAAGSHTFRLGWIDAAAHYLVEDGATGERREMPGTALREYTATLEKAPDGELIFFTRLD